MSEIYLETAQSSRRLVNGLRDISYGSPVKVYDAKTNKFLRTDPVKTFEELITDKKNLRKRDPKKEGVDIIIPYKEG